MVDPAFGAELAHQCVDPGKSRAALFPALEPEFGFGGGNSVGVRGEASGLGENRW